MTTSTRVWIRFLVLTLIMAGALAGCVRYTDSAFDGGDPEKAERAYVRLGLAYLQEEQYGRARQNLNRALEINNNSAPALSALGLLNDAQGETEVADERFREALRADSSYTRARHHYGAFLFNQGRHEDAYEQLKQAADDPEYDNRARAFVNLGQAARRLDRHDEAADAYERALRLDRTSFDALEGAAVSSVDAERYARAQPLFERLIREIRASDQRQHTPRTLWAGIRLADHYGDEDQKSSLGLLLRNLYPDSAEHEQYRAMSGHE